MNEMVVAIQDEIQTALPAALSNMIFSHSGWRGVFAADDSPLHSGEESRTGEISEAHAIIAAAAAAVFAEYLHSLGNGNDEPLILVGSDTRPTGNAIAEAILSVLPVCGCRVRYAGLAAAPEIMAWARSCNNQNCGFIYISASHNPIGHNGLKFGLNDGGVLPAAQAAQLAANFRAFIGNADNIVRLEAILANSPNTHYRFNAAVPPAPQEFVAESEAAYHAYNNRPSAAAKQEAWNAYFNFSNEVAYNGQEHIAAALKRGITQQPLGVCCDFNGSARCVSIDKDFFENLGIQFAAINEQPGAIAHRIVPEGNALDPCRAFLEEQHRQCPAFALGYVPDCDGDRGNLVIWDETLRQTRALEAQEVFALACIAELAQHAWQGSGGKTAVAVNDPTSLRIDRIAEAFGAGVFRAEVGEANVVGLARILREQGYTVRILGEGSAGGTITHPSAVRDPLHTVLAIAKLLSLRSENGKPGLFELWCTASGQPQRYRSDFTLADCIASLPPFFTTGAYSPEAALRVSSADHGALKSRYQHIFLREWENRADELKARYGIHHWEAAAYNGMEERRGISNFGEAGAGGLKICFFNAGGAAIASLWMRGSATEPVFRIMADAEDERAERDFIAWQRRMVMEANASSSVAGS